MARYVAAVVCVLVLAWTVKAQQSAVSPDGKLQAKTKGATLMIVDAATGKELVSIKSHTDDVTGLAFSPDGKLIASTGKDKKLCLMDLATGRLLAQTNLGGVPASVDFSNDGKTITAKYGKVAESFDAATLKKLP